VVLHGGESLNHDLHDEEQFVIPAPVQITLIDNLIIGLDIPNDFPDMNRGRFSLVEDHLLMESCMKCAPQWAKRSTSFQKRTRNQLEQMGAAESQPFQRDNGSVPQPVAKPGERSAWKDCDRRMYGSLVHI
jgi:hypothetical protein